MKMRKIKTGILYRDVEIDRERDLDKDNRTVSLSFSSETPVERYFGNEILDHGPKSVRLDRMRTGGPLLVDHERTDLAGVVQDISVGGDRKGRAVVRFGRSQRANEVYQDVVDGIRTGVSVGYRIHEMIVDGKKDDVVTYRATDWEPLEISLVSIPADFSVGVGRKGEEEFDTTVIEKEETKTKKSEERKMDKCTKCGTDLINGICPACEARAKLESARADSEKAERTRVSEIMAIGQRQNMLDMALNFVKEGKPLDEFRAAVIEKIGNARPLDLGKVEVGKSREEDRPFRSLGEFLMSVADAASPGNRIDPRLMKIRAASGASEGIPSDGGFLVQQDFTTALLAKTNETGILKPKCRTIPIGPGANGLKAPIVDETSRATGSRWGGIQIYRTAEAGTATASKPKLAMLNVSLEKLMGICYATEELLKDATALEAIISQGFSEEFGFKIDDEIVNGTGAGECLGILAADCLVSVAKENGQAAATVVADNVEKMYARLWTRGVPNATWYINQAVWPQLFKLSHAVGTGGVPIFMPPGGLSAAPFGTLFGRPIQPIEQCAALGTVGDIIFADLSQYLFIEKDGLAADSSIHVRFIYDEMTYKFTMRNNGQPMWKSKLTPYKGSDTISPFVALATRA